uniref:uncharacterized protein LOC122597745 n=1 Tax=Erigeron canadensis TaxID=72917 RepID=UPI001CB8DBE1|nr:uncharacterized protein LOC122597745 [Erigeron canadensis]
MVAFSGFYTFGTIVQALLVWLIIPNYSWRWLMGAAIAPHFAASCLIWLVPESPRFLCEQGRVVAAHFVLVAGAAINSRKLPERTLIYDQVTSNVGIDQPVRTRGPLERLEEAHVGHGISSPSINHEDSTDSTLTLPLLNKSYANPNDFDSQETGSVFDGSPRSTRNNLGTLAQTDIVNDDNSANTGQNPLESVTGDFLGHLEESAHNSADISMYSPERTNSLTEIFDDEHDERHNDENDDERVNDANEISTIQDERLNIVNDDERQNDENEIHTIHDERSNDVNDDERQNDENEIRTIHDERFNDVNDDERQNDENEIHSIHDEGFNDVNDDERQNDENEIHIMVPQLPFSSSFGSGSHSITSILSPRWRRTTLLIWVLYFFNTFNYYEFVLLTFQSSPGSLFTAKDFKNSWPLRNVFIISLAEIPGLIIAAIMLNKFERKFSIIILLVAGAFVIFLIMFFQGKVLTLILMFLARMFMWSSFVLVQIYSTEAFPTTLRTTGVLVATALGNTRGTVWPIISSIIHESGYMLPFLLYEAKMLVTGLCVSLIPVGTTQRNLELPVQQNRPGD